MANTLVYNPFTGTLDYAGTGGGGAATPGGPNGAVQFNSAGTFGGDAALTWDNTAGVKRLGIGLATGILAQVHTQLNVAAGGNSQHAMFDQYNNAGVTGPLLVARRSRGTPGVAAALQPGDQVFNLNGRGDDGTGVIGADGTFFTQGNRVNVLLAAGGTLPWSAGSNPTQIDFNTTAEGSIVVSSAVPRLRIADDGTILVNTTAKIAGSKVIVTGGALHVIGGNALRLQGAGPGFTSFVDPTHAANIAYTLPAAQATVAGQALTNDATGVLSWATPGSNPTGPAGGDLTGSTYPNPLISAINGAAVGLTTPLVQGDLLVANATPAFARFLGNATATKQYLSMTSGVPLWAAIPGGDVTGAALTKTDDTNVTLALGGTPATALLRAASLTLGWSGQLAVGRGGTGLATGTSGGLLGFTGPTTLASSTLLTQHALVLGGGAGATPSTPVGLGTATTVLHGNATGDPSFGAVSLNAGGDVTGQLPIANGGTGAGAKAVAFNALAPSSVQGDLIVLDNTLTNVRLPLGTINQKYLRNDGSNPAWVDPTLFDDFTQYLKLGGRDAPSNNPTLGSTVSGTITGSAGSNLNLTLIACAGTTKGLVRIQDELRVYTSNVLINQARFGVRFATNLNISGGTAGFTAYAVQGTFSQTGLTGSVSALFDAGFTYNVNTGATAPIFYTLFNRPTIVANVANTITTSAGLIHAPSFQNGTGSFLNCADVGLQCASVYGAAQAGLTRWGLDYHDAGIDTASNIAVDVAEQTDAGPLVRALRSAITDGVGTAKMFLEETGGARSEFKGMFTRYRNVPTAGWGIPGINGFGRSTAQTAPVAAVAAYTLGSADGTVLVSANVLVTTSTTHNFNVQVSYTDEGNTARTVTMNVQQLAGTFVTAITNITGVGPYEGIPLHLRCKASTTVTVKTTGTFTAVTYNVEGVIVQVA